MPGATTFEMVFTRLVALRGASDQCTIHLSSVIRKSYFDRLDQIIIPEYWDPNDDLPSVDSFKDFLWLVVFMKFASLPQLALNQDGTFVACWYRKDIRLTLECMGHRHVRWIVSHSVEDETEYGAGVCQMDRLTTVLAPYVHNKPIFA